MPNRPFRDQVVIVTGASAGIGRGVVLQLASQQARVAIAARPVDRLEHVAAEGRQRVGDLLVVPTDVADEAQCQALIERTVAGFGRLDMLINNAGLAASALLGDFPNLCLFRDVMNVNF